MHPHPLQAKSAFHFIRTPPSLAISLQQQLKYANDNNESAEAEAEVEAEKYRNQWYASTPHFSPPLFPSHDFFIVEDIDIVIDIDISH
ncbi:hypothetical protein Q7P37_002791 [Cladosporium fusiforme]